jgi:acyl-CoA thioester hydrolase
MNQPIFRHYTPIRVRYADLDTMRHVNNASYMSYTEEARIAYCREVLGWDGNLERLDMLLARFEIDYLLPVLLFDDIGIYTRCSRLGHKSFDFEYRFVRRESDGSETTVARGKTVLVAFSVSENRSIPLPEAMRQAFLAYEPSPIAQ